MAALKIEVTVGSRYIGDFGWIWRLNFRIFAELHRSRSRRLFNFINIPSVFELFRKNENRHFEFFDVQLSHTPWNFCLTRKAFALKSSEINKPARCYHKYDCCPARWGAVNWLWGLPSVPRLPGFGGKSVRNLVLSGGGTCRTPELLRC